MVVLDHAAGLSNIATGRNVQWNGEILLFLNSHGHRGSDGKGGGLQELVDEKIRVY